MSAIIEMGKISSRGQVAIPTDIINRLGLSEGSKVLFFNEDDSLLIKKVTEQTFAQKTIPFFRLYLDACLRVGLVPTFLQASKKTMLSNIFVLASYHLRLLGSKSGP